MSTIGKLPIVISDQPQPRLMDQRHGLQSLIGRFIRHFGRRQLAQFFWIPWFPWSAEIAISGNRALPQDAPATTFPSGNV